MSLTPVCPCPNSALPIHLLQNDAEFWIQVRDQMANEPREDRGNRPASPRTSQELLEPTMLRQLGRFGTIVNLYYEDFVRIVGRQPTPEEIETFDLAPPINSPVQVSEELARNQEPPLFEPTPPLPRHGRKRKDHWHEDDMVRWACGETASVRNVRLRKAVGGLYTAICCGWCLEGLCDEHEGGRWNPFQ